MKYRPKGATVEAHQFTYPPTKEFKKFLGGSLEEVSKARHPGAKAYAFVRINGPDGVHLFDLEEGEWITRNDKAAYEVLDPIEFSTRYEPETSDALEV